MREKILNALDCGPGFYILSLLRPDLDLITLLIKKNYQDILRSAYPNQYENISKTPMENYHLLNSPLHGDILGKSARLFSEKDVEIFKSTIFYSSLVTIFPELKITNEDNERPEEIYWRLVRPNIPTDIGPLHADEWFWDLEGNEIPSGTRRIKLWFSIINEPAKNGFRLINGSQKKKFSYQGELRNGKIKPVNCIDLELDKDLEIINTQPGDCIIFHDSLIHGGAAGGSATRVSFEFTILVNK